MSASKGKGFYIHTILCRSKPTRIEKNDQNWENQKLPIKKPGFRDKKKRINANNDTFCYSDRGIIGFTFRPMAMMAVQGPE
jgi:hypothetical protein